MSKPSPAAIDHQRLQRLAYTLQEAATVLRVSVSTVRRGVSHDLIRSIKIGALTRIPAEEVMRLVRDGLKSIPAGYKRKTAGQTNRGGQTKTKTKPKRAEP